jgi:hypothetical protein
VPVLAEVNGLSAYTTDHYRLEATDANGTSFGNDVQDFRFTILR